MRGDEHLQHRLGIERAQRLRLVELDTSDEGREPPCAGQLGMNDDAGEALVEEHAGERLG
jgi:hypothetical protein